MNKYFGIEKEFSDGRQPFEMLNKNSGSGWFAPKRYLKGLPGVVKCELVDTTSSAGDWSGYYAVKGKNGISLVMFSQANNYPAASGYTLRTNDEAFAVVGCENEIEEAVNEYLESFV